MASNPSLSRTPDEQAALETFQAFLAGLKTRSPHEMKDLCLTTGVATVFRNGEFTSLTLHALIDRVTSMFPVEVAIEETIHDVEVRVDDNLAMIWAPFRTFLDGRLRSEGTNVASLGRVDGKWLVTGLADTSRLSEDQKHVKW
jgi:hypothetical protein